VRRTAANPPLATTPFRGRLGSLKEDESGDAAVVRRVHQHGRVHRPGSLARERHTHGAAKERHGADESMVGHEHGRTDADAEGHPYQERSER